VVYDDPFSSNYDRWHVALVKLSKGSTSVTVDLFPWLLAEMDSVSGFGIPDASAKELVNSVTMN